MACNIPDLMAPAVGSNFTWTPPALALVTMAGRAAGALAFVRSPEALSVLILPGLAAAGGSILLPASTLPISPLAVM